MTDRPVDAAVAAVVATYPGDVRAGVLAVRALILHTAGQLPAVGPLTEALRWGQPSYLPATSRSGTTIRLGWHRPQPHTFSLYVHCQTTLIETFATLYPDVFDLIGNREIRFATDRPLPTDELRHCIELALTYHLPAGGRRR
ncbi:DUF1801 domain-containing protein [Dactylosporangium sp. NPDC049525]|uniref:DUF1801 domain-containing protein n=1 Tax=Dactylosporangium sp. NPDC049525 TaxID=3154730 RepID=UPI003420FABC